jgi:hypothetical protein
MISLIHVFNSNAIAISLRVYVVDMVCNMCLSDELSNSSLPVYDIVSTSWTMAESVDSWAFILRRPSRDVNDYVSDLSRP